MERSLNYRSNIQEIPGIRKDLEELLKSWNVTDTDQRQIIMIFEELFANIVRFAFPDDKPHQVHFKLKRHDREIVLLIVDDGVPFNPLEYKTKPVSDPASAEEGGMGLTLVRTFSDSISYQRDGGRNNLTIHKTLRNSFRSNSD